VAVTTAPPTTAASTTAAATVTTQPQTQFSPVTGFPGKLSIVGNDNNIYISRFDGKPPALLLGKAGVSVNAGQDGELFIFPTWSHDGTKLAAGSFLFHNGTPDSVSIYVAAADGSNTFKVQDAEKFTPVYLSWSPDGNYLSMLVGNTGSNELDLRVVDTSKGAAGVKANGPRSLLHGNPLYSSWAADSDTLVIHFTSSGLNVLSQVKAKDAKSSPQPFKLTGDPGAFRAPAWSADGSRLAFSTVLQGQSNEVIVVQDKNGALQGTIDGVGQGAVFNWSPNGARLAYGLRAGSSQRLYDGVLLSDLAGADAPKNGKISGTKIINDPVLSFFWSPDGKKLAYSTIDNASSRFVWNVYDLDSKKSTKLADWYPSDETTQVLSFFDQYAQSDSLWSPDSKALVFSGWVNATINNSTLTGDPIVYVMPTEGAKAGQVQAVAPGGLAFWAK
jgi:Tol biopolymer transport system component